MAETVGNCVDLAEALGDSIPCCCSSCHEDWELGYTYDPSEVQFAGRKYEVCCHMADEAEREIRVRAAQEQEPKA